MAGGTVVGIGVGATNPGGVGGSVDSLVGAEVVDTVAGGGAAATTSPSREEAVKPTYSRLLEE